MPTRKKGGGKTHRKTKPPGAKSTCNLPHDVIVNILSRLSTKELHRLRCVCKPWRSLFRNPKFISLHLNRSSQNPNTTDFIIHSIHQTSADHILSIFRRNSLGKPIDLHHPFPYYFLEMDVVGSYNGLICLCQPPWGDVISIWNPATKQSKGVRLSGTKPNADLNDKVSMGFGFDSAANDYKVISILCFKPVLKRPARVEVFSADAGVWRKIVDEPTFHFSYSKCSAVVKGIPYWTAIVDDKFGVREAFVSFDVHNEVFNQVLVPFIPGRSEKYAHLTDLKDSLAVVVYSMAEELSKHVDVWMMDDDGNGMECWSKKYTVGPIFGMARMVGCLKNGDIVAENAEGKMFFYDIETRGSKFLHIDGARKNCFEVFNYMESLVSIKGAASFEKEDATRELINRTGIHLKVKSSADGRSSIGCIGDPSRLFEWA